MRGHAADQHWLPCVGATNYNRDVEQMFMDCRNFGAPSGYWAKRWHYAADVMAFTSPKQSAVFLLSDLCAFIVSRHERGKDVWGLYEKLQSAMWKWKRFQGTDS